ncbi:MAG: amidase [Chloroflexota bacterium]
MYDLKSINLPKLVGQPLKLFATFLESRLGQTLLLPKLLKDGGITHFRNQQFDEPPTYFPLVPPANESAETTEPQLDFDFSSIQSQMPYRTAADYVQAYSSGKTTPLAVANAFLNAIDQLQAQERPLNAFISINREDLLTQAQSATERYQTGAMLSQLDGVPIAVKDEMDMVPYPTTVGTSFWGRKPAERDSTAVSRLRSAGALLVGKTNMYEIGISPEGFNAHYGVVRNPFNLDHDSGGSSSGSAAAVGAGLCPIAIGADGGGSIRVPAAHCGLVGLKATYGRISGFGGAPLDWSVAHLGPIGASVQDVMLAYSTIAGPDAKDPSSMGQPPVKLGNLAQSEVNQLKIGIYPDWFNHASPEIVHACQNLIDEFKRAGATLQEIEIPQLDNMRVAHVISILSEMTTSMQNIKARNRDFGAPVRVNLALGRAVTARDYVHAQRLRTRALSIFKDIFSSVDLIVTPTTAVTAPPIPSNSGTAGWNDLSTVTELMRFVFVGNLTGIPAITFPVGYDNQGLPIGMQLMANHWQEDILFTAARFAEQLVERKKPGLWVSLM